MPDHEFLRGLADDGFETPEIRPHSLEKIRIHNYYVSLFTTSMRLLWPQLAYLGLYSGPGRARLAGTGEIIETTALSALRMPHPFTKYILVDNDPQCIAALRARVAALPASRDVEFIEADVNVAADRILGSMPHFDRKSGLLSFCFIDPFSAELDFEVVRRLGKFRMDFLILLMLGRDVRTNFTKYLQDAHDTRIAKLIDHPNWRTEWRERALQPKDLIRFIYEKFDAAMTRIGYQANPPEEAHPIRIAGKRVFLYSLVLYSKNPLGKQFWQATRQGTDPQIRLGI